MGFATSGFSSRVACRMFLRKEFDEKSLRTRPRMLADKVLAPGFKGEGRAEGPVVPSSHHPNLGLGKSGMGASQQNIFCNEIFIFTS